jgi:hypothetical protein
MNTRRGYPLVIAPRFQLPADWARRLLVSAGIDRREGTFVPQSPWRRPSSEELSALAAPALAPDPDGAVSLFCLPLHLMQRWWGLLSRAEESGEDLLAGFPPFASEVRDFLAYKGLDVSAGAVFDLVVNEAGVAAAHWAQRGAQGAGLGLNLPSGVWGVVNMSAESVSILLVNVTPQEMLAALPGDSADGPPSTPGELASRYLSLRGDQPVLRLSLAPGEGVRLPAHETIVGRCTLDQEDPDVTLLIRGVARTHKGPRERVRRAVPLAVLA